MTRIRDERHLSELRTEYLAKLSSFGRRIFVCVGPGCILSGGNEVYEAFREGLKARGLDAEFDDAPAGPSSVNAVKTGCHGFCDIGPLVRIEPGGVTYCHVKPADVYEIIERTILRGDLVERLLYVDPATGEPIAHECEIPFYKRQIKIALSGCGRQNAEDLREYIAGGGYSALAKCLTSMAPKQVIDIVTESGLRGRGGGGFPTGKKWGFAAVQQSDVKYMICNGDEGDPGAFMDRAVMEGDPHRVIEGLAIAGYAIGANHGYIYVRAEYPIAILRLRRAIDQAEQAGLLGDGILGTDFDFHLKIKEGAGAFVCGEETALMASIEGKRGMPRPRPPFPAVSGLFGKPTIINNVETLANVAEIINRGAAWFKGMGTPTSTGTKTFALTGQVNNTGLIEVPMGITLREVVFDIGGGIKNGRKFKAVQIGGPSGGCLTEEHLDLPLDYDSLQKAGAMMGSGGMVVVDETTCMVEMARFFMNFTQNESCGKCVPCREGTRRMLELLTKVTSDRAKPEDLETLEDIAMVVKDSSLCNLGKTAPNPVLTTFKYFKDEYYAHIVDRVCPSHVCKAFEHYVIVAELCKGCGKCKRYCPVDAISGDMRSLHVIDFDKCIKCGACAESCAFNAVVIR